ncbi:MAG: ribosome small subunit-dependent GTPase A [Bacilli bacterium]
MKDLTVLSSTSLGFRLYDHETGEISLHPKRGKATFRKDGILIGDYVTLDKDGLIDNVLKRSNQLSRPRLSNADLVLILVSAKEPLFSSYLLDKFLTLTECSSMKSAIVITKCDLLTKKEKEVLIERLSYYQKEGFSYYLVDCHDETKYSYSTLKAAVLGKRVALMGQTGVGKSSLLNLLCPGFQRKVDSLDVEIGRGRHTTKEVIMLPYENGFLYDTPGFSELELTDITENELASFFPGFRGHFASCKFNDCQHLKETKGCEIVRCVENNDLSADSYYNYLKIREEVRKNNVWKKKI